jgi:hypothetical protein
MALFSKTFKPIGAVLDRIICVVMALLLAQFPVYYAQYLDVLSGARMAASKTYEDMQTRLGPQAQQRGLSVDELVEQLTRNDDPLVRELSGVNQDAIVRYQAYSEAFEALKQAPVWQRPFALSRHFDNDIHQAIQFEPNVPLTLEGVIYAFLGILLGMLLAGLLRRIWKALFKSKDPRP